MVAMETCVTMPTPYPLPVHSRCRHIEKYRCEPSYCLVTGIGFIDIEIYITALDLTDPGHYKANIDPGIEGLMHSKLT